MTTAAKVLKVNPFFEFVNFSCSQEIELNQKKMVPLCILHFHCKDDLQDIKTVLRRGDEYKEKIKNRKLSVQDLIK